MKYIQFILIAVLLSGCYTQKKAAEQIDKALDKYPAEAAKQIRDKFPCITTSVDSSEFLQSIATLDSLLNESMIRNLETNERLMTVRDSLANVFNSPDTNYTCEDEKADLLNYSSRLFIENEGLRKSISKKEKAISDLSYTIRNIKPVIKKEADSAALYLKDKDIREITADRDKWKEKYQSLKGGSVVHGNLLVPWWVFAILAVAVGISIKSKLLRFGK